MVFVFLVPWQHGNHFLSPLNQNELEGRGHAAGEGARRKQKERRQEELLRSLKEAQPASIQAQAAQDIFG